MGWRARHVKHLTLAPRPTDDLRIAELVRQRRPASTLPGSFYTDPVVFERDIEWIFSRHWIFVGHEDRVRKPGDYFVFSLARDSFIVMRGRDGQVRTFANVCRHRGSLICTEAQGNALSLVCPYHAWVYDTSGRLLCAGHMGESFDPSAHNLHGVHTRILFGSIYVSLAERPLALEPGERAIARYIGPHNLERAQIAARQEFVLQANWKLLLENFLECYHCAPAHPEYCRVNPRAPVAGLSTMRPEYVEEMLQWLQKTSALGHMVGGASHEGTPTEEACGVNREPLGPGFLTSSPDGQPVGPVMGSFKGHDGGQTQWSIGPVSYGLADSDHAVLFRFLPLDTRRTSVELTWLVDGSAYLGTEVDVDRLTWLWRVTFAQDEALINASQQGVDSGLYEAGPYAETESVTNAWIERYLAEIS